MVKGVYISVMPKMIKKEYRDRAIELIAADPNLDLQSIANICGVSMSTIKNWGKESDFGNSVYEKYMATTGIPMAQVNAAMFREAKLGNVQAARYCADIKGMMIKRVSVQIDSPYDMFLKTKKVEAAAEAEWEEVKDLPPRDPINDKPKTRSKEDNKKIKAIMSITPEQRAKNRKKSLASYRRIKRAKKVGLEPLGRKTGKAKRNWYAELEKREKEMGII